MEIVFDRDIFPRDVDDHASEFADRDALFSPKVERTDRFPFLQFFHRTHDAGNDVLHEAVGAPFLPRAHHLKGRPPRILDRSPDQRRNRGARLQIVILVRAIRADDASHGHAHGFALGHGEFDHLLTHKLGPSVGQRRIRRKSLVFFDRRRHGTGLQRGRIHVRAAGVEVPWDAPSQDAMQHVAVYQHVCLENFMGSTRIVVDASHLGGKVDHRVHPVTQPGGHP